MVSVFCGFLAEGEAEGIDKERRLCGPPFFVWIVLFCLGFDIGSDELVALAVDIDDFD